MIMFRRRLASSSAAFLSAIVLTSTGLAAPPDANLDTQFSFASDFSSVNFIVCGSLPLTEGCYGFGTLGLFGHVGAMLSGFPTATGDMATRGVYIVDVAGGPSSNEVILYHYVITNSITDNASDSVTSRLDYQRRLPLVGGKNVRCSIAGNTNVLVVGTDQSTQAVLVNKSTVSTQVIGGFSDAPTVTAITADAYGFISVQFGGGDGFVLIGPSGGPVEDGGGQSFVISSMTGLSTQDIVINAAPSAESKMAEHPVTLRSSSKQTP